MQIVVFESGIKQPRPLVSVYS